MNGENRGMGVKASATGNKVSHLMEDSRTGIAGLAGIPGIYE